MIHHDVFDSKFTDLYFPNETSFNKTFTALNIQRERVKNFFQTNKTVIQFKMIKTKLLQIQLNKN
jgi:hypothetical protein